MAAALFGDTNRWGKLPITIYPANYTSLLDAAGAGIADYAMAKGPGRSYRYFNGTPLCAPPLWAPSVFPLHSPLPAPALLTPC